MMSLPVLGHQAGKVEINAPAPTELAVQVVLMSPLASAGCRRGYGMSAGFT